MEKTKAYYKRLARRKVLPGFPVEEPFKNIEAVRDYFKNERVTCMLCGKIYKKLGNHLLKIHGVTCDSYRQRYNIPWTYGLICEESSVKYSEAVIKRFDEGWVPPMKIGEDHKKLISAPKRKTKFKGEIGTQNFGDAARPKHPLTLNPRGELETFTAKRERETARRGSEEFKEKMRNRPQAKGVFRKDGVPWWRGKKQTQDHLRNRMKSIWGEGWENK